jgi:hypothetical protein
VLNVEVFQITTAKPNQAFTASVGGTQFVCVHVARCETDYLIFPQLFSVEQKSLLFLYFPLPTLRGQPTGKYHPSNYDYIFKLILVIIFIVKKILSYVTLD